MKYLPFGIYEMHTISMNRIGKRESGKNAANIFVNIVELNEYLI